MSRRLLLLLAIVAFAAPGLVVKAQQQPAASPQPQGPPGILRGVVVRAGTSEPIRDVRISLGSGSGNANAAQLLESALAAGLNANVIEGLLESLNTNLIQARGAQRSIRRLPQMLREHLR
jgi:hypothetical protein